MSGEIRKVGVCGAGGTMGSGIAIVSARAGYMTTCYDTNREILDRSLAQTKDFLARSVERGKMLPQDATAAFARLVPSDAIEELADCDLVIEAVFEDLPTKQALLHQLDGICASHTIFASNTSTLSITEIASGCDRQDRVVGMHFCLPAQLMKLIEMSPGLNTSDEAFESAWNWALAAEQHPVRTLDRPGFILNALLVPFNNDCIRAVEAGVASPTDLDRAIKAGLGYRMGPLELVDLIGLDTQIRLSEAFYPVTLDPRAAAPPLLRRMVAAGRLGRKSGQGFFDYEATGLYGG